jgi:archaellum component FlaF (FlaF/FlaG flagellin family)
LLSIPQLIQRIAFVFCTALFLNACNLINPAEPVPAYIKIHPPVVITQTAQGSSSENISNYWIFLNNQSIGVFNRTGNYPIIPNAEGTTTLSFLAGIKDNGSGNLRVVYPFYTADTISAILKANEHIDVYPTFKYIPGTQFKVVEDFELGSTLVNMDTSNVLVRTNNVSEVFEGSYSAKMILDATHPAIELISIDPFSLPLNGYDIYIELNYKSDVAFKVGLMAVNTSQKFYQWTINPKDSWNKIYLNARSLVNSVNTTQWKLIIYSNPDNLSTPKYLYLDNIKVLHL